MQTTYLITSPKFAGHVSIAFNTDGNVVLYEATTAELSVPQCVWFKQHLNLLETDFINALKRIEVTAVRQTKEITFEMFWDRYNEKVRSSKKKSQLKWNRMSQAQRSFAYYFIPKYEQSIPAGVAKKYADTYLNHELWNN